ncbi:MAG: Gfo/Idh/MocA family oxidoreductase [Thermomicrobiales bacterium]
MTGERIVEVQALAGQVNDAGIDVEDVLSLAFRYESGATGAMHCAFVLPRTMSAGYFAIRGEHGSLTVNFDGSVSSFGAGNRDDPVREETPVQHSRIARLWQHGTGSHSRSARLDRREPQPLANGDALVAALGVIDAAYESARTGTRVTVD